jgi:hypothetical protein
MVAYPLAPSPTLAEFTQVLTGAFQCELRQLEGGLKDPAGQIHSVCYFERTVDGERLQCVVDAEPEDRLLPSVVRNLCRRLRIDPATFGLTLG